MMSDNIWTTKEGTDIPIDEMTDSHLLNTIHFLERNANYEIMVDAIERSIDTNVEDLTANIYLNMLKLAKKRGLTN